MKLSVVTVCFNSEKTIAHTLESFLAQRHRDSELLVIDGGSKDRTMAIAGSYADPRIRITSEPDRGIFDAMNKGLERFGGDAVGFLNSDDCYAGDHALAAIAEGLAHHDMVSGNLDFVDDHVHRRVVRRWRGTAHVQGAFRTGWMPAHPTFYMRRKVAEAVGRFDLRYRIAADYDYMLRAYERHGFTSVHLDRILVHMMMGGSSTAGIRAYWNSNVEALKSRRQWLGAGQVDYAFLAKPLRKIGQFLPGRTA